MVMTNQARTLSWVHAIPLDSLDRSHRSTVVEEGHDTQEGAQDCVALGYAPHPTSPPRSREGLTITPECVLLPPSRSSSVIDEHEGPDNTTQVTSARDLASHLVLHTDGPASLRQLESAVGNNYRPVSFPSTIPDDRPRGPTDYWSKVAALAESFSHLRTLPFDHESRYSTIGKVVCMDYSRDAAMPHLFKSWSSDRFSSRDSKWSEKIETLRTHLAIDLVARMILVEDLLEELMEALGSTFNLDPEFFAEHLVRAAHNRVDYIDTFTEPPTSPEAEPTYASLTWIRPLNRVRSSRSGWTILRGCWTNGRSLLNEAESQRKSAVSHGWISPTRRYTVSQRTTTFSDEAGVYHQQSRVRRTRL